MTSTAPATTLIAVSSSITYAGPDKPAAHCSAAAMVLLGRSGLSRCGKIEKSTTPSVVSPAGECQLTKSSPTRGVITMLPALTPTQTVSSSDGRRSTRPDSRIQWHRYAASPPSPSRTSISDQRDPALRVEAREGGELQDSNRLPADPDRGSAGLLPADAPPRLVRAGPGMPVQRRGNAEGIGFGDRLAQQLDQSVLDACVLDAGGRKKKSQCSLQVAVQRRVYRDSPDAHDSSV